MVLNVTHLKIIGVESSSGRMSLLVGNLKTHKLIRHLIKVAFA